MNLRSQYGLLILDEAGIKQHKLNGNLETKWVLSQENLSLVLATWPHGYKTFYMLNSTEHGISTAHKSLYNYKKLKKKNFSRFKTLQGYIHPANKY